MGGFIPAYKVRGASDGRPRIGAVPGEPAGKPPDEAGHTGRTPPGRIFSSVFSQGEVHSRRQIFQPVPRRKGRERPEPPPSPAAVRPDQPQAEQGPVKGLQGQTGEEPLPLFERLLPQPLRARFPGKEGKQRRQEPRVPEHPRRRRAGGVSRRGLTARVKGR